MNHKVALIVVHEIYGVNEHMQDVVTTFSSQHIDVFCPNLLQHNTPFHYEKEQKAYSHFMHTTGFQHGKEKIENMILQLYKDYTYIGLIGFSVGATIAWLCSKNQNVDFVIGCYGSRIRDYTHIVPTCPTLLIFPEKEASFSVPSLITAVQKQNNPFLHVQQLPGEHGFLDPYTTKYNEKSTKQAFEMINSFLAKIVIDRVKLP
ncbi:dienelactone hydrolase family protein [Bacillus sp. DX4.1]|uniref:dienelactone hydrolase family protein n=1 Tax=Bacillus sp. DX4.1 TaxID=3055867 RepID=UPI0025A228DF|nr:dienelactone hydrolase family protein [Bacillus sp. DX4.1]MDM5187955.1 dienelactone hydrolase family protein [Bacillus sp. DX4.1]